MKNIFYCALLLCLISFREANADNAHAPSAHDHGHPAAPEQHAVHVHGEAVLTVIIEHQGLHIELISPAVNIVGFEHEINSAQESQQVLNALRVLNDADNIFRFTGTSCTQVHSKVVSPFATKVGAAKVKSDFPEHKEFVASYQMECKGTQGERAMDVLLFESFSGLESIDVQWVADGKQAAKRTNAKNNSIIFH